MGKLKADSTAYTRNQLQVVNPKEKNNVEPLMENESDRYVVQKIVDRRKQGKTFEYLIKWKGIRSPTWEQKSQLIDDIPQLIDRFDKKFDKNNLVK